MKLPRGEETLPIIEIEEKFLTLDEVRTLYPDVYERLIRPELRFEFTVSDQLLIERFRMRMAQGRERTIYRLQNKCPFALTPEEQLRHMELRDEIGLELIEAERQLLEEELALLKR